MGRRVVPPFMWRAASHLVVATLFLGTIVGRGGALPATSGTDASRGLPPLGWHPGLARLEQSSPTGPHCETAAAIATVYHSPPSRAELAALESLGLRARPFRRLPLASVAGPRQAMVAAIRQGIAADVYPDARIVLDQALPDPLESPRPVELSESAAAVGASDVVAGGIDGSGIGVAVIDTGIDATHPDLAGRVTHNLKVLGPEYASCRPDQAPPAGVVVGDDEPVGNTDLTSGHGTHVAGIVAGVAPGAHLVGYAVGDGTPEPGMFTVLAAMDHLLAHHRAWRVGIVNNSWSGFTQHLFDPGDPINLATRALHDDGLVVVFSAGNLHEEMTLNQYSVAPWVTSVGSMSLDHVRTETSSAGIEGDNAAGPPEFDRIDPDGARVVRFSGDHLGIYHPDLSAPGDRILSAASSTGAGELVLGARKRVPGEAVGSRRRVAISGTSMAAPHVAAVAALLRQARPDLTPSVVAAVLRESTAPTAEPVWRSGHGFLDAVSALRLARAVKGSGAALATPDAGADERALRRRPAKVLASDTLSFTADPAAAPPNHPRTHVVTIAAETRLLKVVIAFPGRLDPAARLDGQARRGVGGYSLRLVDQAGTELARSTPTAAFTAILCYQVDPMAGGGGPWTLQILSRAGTNADSVVRPADFADEAVTVVAAQFGPPNGPAGTGAECPGAGQR